MVDNTCGSTIKEGGEQERKIVWRKRMGAVVVRVDTAGIMWNRRRQLTIYATPITHPYPMPLVSQGSLKRDTNQQESSTFIL